MTQFGHCGNGDGPSYMISTWDLQFLYMKCYLSPTGVWDLVMHPYIRQDTELRTQRKYTMYISLLPTLVSPYQVWDKILPWVISM